MKYLIITLTSLLFLLFRTESYSQNKESITKETYTAQKDSLNNLKKILIIKKTHLQSEIDSLKTHLEMLDKNLESAEADLKEWKHKLFIRKYGREDGSRVYEGRVWKGMTESMLRDGWGEPDKIHKDVYKWGVFTQWYYGDITYFFKNGRLIDWEQKK